MLKVSRESSVNISRLVLLGMAVILAFNSTVYSQSEACCWPNGSCSMEESSVCERGGGVPQGQGTNCSGVTCSSLLEACCWPNGSCSMEDIVDCLLNGGVPQGSGSDCISVECTMLDCNNNGVPDPDDISGGTSQDCQPDGIPDECQLVKPCSEPDVMIKVVIYTDNWPNETTWELIEQGGGIVASDGPYASPYMLYTHNIPVCSNGCYDFTIFDSYGDGMTLGWYEVYYDGYLIATGNVFGSEETTTDIGGCSGDNNNDCNNNGVPDECDIADGTSQDCQPDGIPDECQLVKPCSEPNVTIEVVIYTDSYPGETTWELIEQGVGILVAGGPFPLAQTQYNTEIPLCSDSCYDFTIFDSYGDGMTPGWYEVYYDGYLIATGSDFGPEESTTDIGGCYCDNNNDCNNNGVPDECEGVCKVTFEDLANFTSLWLQTGTNAADLDGEADGVDFEDYGIFSGYWQDFCPDGWQLK